MTKTLAITAAGLLLCSAAAIAQTTGTTSTTPDKSSATPPALNATPLRQEMADSLKKAGFTDVKVVPDSFFVQAKDKSGNPVAMLINPNSMTELVGATTQADAATPGSQNGGTFVSSTEGDMLSSKLIGADVHNSTKQDIGTIKDVAMKGGMVQAYVLSVGGFLGMGDHYVAVAPSALTIQYDAASKTTHATMNATQAELRSAPSFQFANG
jgi:hypothetical protein